MRGIMKLKFQINEEKTTIPSGVDFIIICAQNLTPFFGEWRSANGTKFRRILGINLANLATLFVVEIVWQFFCTNALCRQLFAWRKSLVKSTPEVCQICNF
jgi:hypothetical protein